MSTPPGSNRHHFSEMGARREARALFLVDDRTRTNIRLVLRELAALADFEVAALARVREDGHMQLVDTFGTSMTENDLERTAMPIDLWWRSIGQTAQWGVWRYTSAEDCPPEVRAHLWVADDVPAAASPAHWDPLCGLDCPIYDDAGQLVGSLALDLPRDGMVPTADRHALLDGLGRFASRAILAILERETAIQRANIAELTHATAARSGTAASVGDLTADTVAALISGIGADHAEAGWFHPALTRPGRPPDDAVLRYRDEVIEHWRAGTVLRLSSDQDSDLRAPGPGATTLMVPVADATTCYGALWVSRSIRASWTKAEIVGAQGLASELGHAITDHRVRSRLRDQVDDLQAEMAHRARLAASVAHDLASPLHAMSNYLDLLQQRSVDDPALRDRLMAALRVGTSQVADVAEQLQLLQLLQGTRHEQRREVVDLLPLLHDVYGLHLPQAQADRQHFALETTLASASVRGNASDLRRVMVNLTSNALKYTPPGGSIRITLERENDRFVLRWHDTGIGIAPAHLPQVFEEFYRAADPWAQSKQGTGLGLPIVARLVDDGGGRVSLTSTLGVGTTVEVRLPAVAEVAHGRPLNTPPVRAAVNHPQLSRSDGSTSG